MGSDSDSSEKGKRRRAVPDVGTEHIAATQRPWESSDTPSPSSTLPPRDSPLTKAYLGQYVSLLMQETVTCLKLSYKGLAQEMSMPETIIREAIQGKLGLTRGHWAKLGQLLRIATNFQIVKNERNGVPCWEVCYPPVASTDRRSSFDLALHHVICRANARYSFTSSGGAGQFWNTL